jgi:two-component system response regulator AtoC
MSNYEKPIMVIDDDRIVASLMQDALETAGYKVITFTDSKKALESIADSGVELIVSDYHMPGLSGLELLKAVNKMQGELRRIMLVIILSGQHDAKIALELVKNRAFSYQSKPLDIQKLLLDVSRAVTTLT